jgi:hypothetical protein
MAHEERPCILFIEDNEDAATPDEERIAMYPSYKAASDALGRLGGWLLAHGYDVGPKTVRWTIAQWANTTVDGVIELLEQLPPRGTKES